MIIGLVSNTYIETIIYRYQMNCFITISLLPCMQVVPIYMGWLVDLSVEWVRYKSAKEELLDRTLTVTQVQKVIVSHRKSFEEIKKRLETVLNDGVLTERFVWV